LSYDLEVPAEHPPAYRTLRDAVDLPDLRSVGDEPVGDAWHEGGLRFFRQGVSSRTTDVSWTDGRLRIVIRALASPEDCDLALRLAELAAGPDGSVETDYFGSVGLPELRRVHGADWMNEQAASGSRVLAAMIREGRGPMSVPGPVRSCWIGTRLLDELERAGPPEALPTRVIDTLRRVQWGLPPGFRDAGVFVSGGEGRGEGKPDRETRFAVWLRDENLVIPRVDYVALRASEGEIVMVPFAAVAELAGERGKMLDECQLLVPRVEAADWEGIVDSARRVAIRAKPVRH
jgi:hypothetical protein